MRSLGTWLQANLAVFVVLIFILIVALVTSADVPTLEVPIYVSLTFLTTLLILYLWGRGR